MVAKPKPSKLPQQYTEAELIDAVETLRNSPSRVQALEDLAAQVCVCCGNRRLGVTRYPAFNSRFFAGQLLLHCARCGLAWVPDRSGRDLQVQ